MALAVVPFLGIMALSGIAHLVFVTFIVVIDPFALALTSFACFWLVLRLEVLHKVLRYIFSFTFFYKFFFSNGGPLRFIYR